MSRTKFIGVTLAALFVTACGGSSPDTAGLVTPAGQAVVVATSPAKADIPPGGKFQFASQVSGTAFTEVTWSVVEADGGTIDANGLYTAPAIEGAYHVRADSKIASVKSTGTSTVRVKKGAVAQVSVAVDPATATVPAGGTRSFAAVVTGTTNQTVTWTMQEASGCGSVSSAGVYTAPNTGAACHVLATSVADATKSGTATITVTAPPPPASTVAISITPTTATLDACRGQVFTATVTNTSNTAVTWTVVESSGGTVTGSGAYVAPAAAGTYRVMAVSQADPARTATATVTVGPEKVLSVAVTPGSGTVNAAGTLAFAANVTTTCGVFAMQ